MLPGSRNDVSDLFRSRDSAGLPPAWSSLLSSLRTVRRRRFLIGAFADSSTLQPFSATGDLSVLAERFPTGKTNTLVVTLHDSRSYAGSHGCKTVGLHSLSRCTSNRRAVIRRYEEKRDEVSDSTLFSLSHEGIDPQSVGDKVVIDALSTGATGYSAAVFFGPSVPFQLLMAGNSLPHLNLLPLPGGEGRGRH